MGLISRHYHQQAIQFANSWATVLGGSVPVMSDTKFEDNGIASVFNVIFFGGKESNSAVTLLLKFPVRFNNLRGDYDEIEGGFRIGKYCNFTGPDIGLLSLGPGPSGLAAIVAGTSISGF